MPNEKEHEERGGRKELAVISGKLRAYKRSLTVMANSRIKST
jgi:hypothetical protein